MRSFLRVGLIGLVSLGVLASCGGDDDDTVAGVKDANAEFCTDLAAYEAAVASVAELDPTTATRSDYSSAIGEVRSSREAVVSSAADLSDAGWTNLQSQIDTLRDDLKDAPDDEAVASILSSARPQVAKVGLSIAAVNTAVCPSNEGAAETTVAESSKTVVVVAQEAPEASTLVKFVTAAGLAATLSGDGPFTIMAPTNDAFAAVPAETVATLEADPSGALTDVLKLHVIPAAVDSAAATAAVGTCVDTLGGKVLIGQDAEGNLTFGGAKVGPVDIKASNGIIHFIDGVVTAASTDCPAA